MGNYPIPAAQTRTEIRVLNSRFIATVAAAFSVEEAKRQIAQIRGEFTDATHHVPAFLIGHGSSVIAHCSDDGEPAGTAGRPILSILQGSGLGDIVIIVTRYFGGTKLGTGGLVRAYGDAAKAVLAILPRAQRIPTHTLLVAMPYNWLERGRLLVIEHGGQILQEEFAADVTLTLKFPVEQFPAFQQALGEGSHGSLAGEIISTTDEIMPLKQLNA